MRLTAHWKTVLRVVLLALFRPGQQIWRRGRQGRSSSGLPAKPAALRPLLLVFGYPLADEQLLRRVRAAQVSAALRLTPFMVVSNLVILTVLIPIGLAWFPAHYVIVWAACVGGLSAYMWIRWQKRRRFPIEGASAKVLARALRQASVLSALWALVPLAALSVGSPAGVWIASTAAIGMMSAGAFALSTLPHAAFRWLFVLYAACMASIFVSGVAFPWTLSLLLTCFFCITIGGVASASWLFTAHFLAEGEMHRRGDLIALMMNQLEEKDSDWLWETRNSGELQNVSTRFLTVSGRSLVNLQAMRLTDLAYTVDEPEAREAFDRLEKAMQDQSAFREIVIGVDIDGEDRWWSLAGQPVHDRHGHFCGYRGVASDVTDSRKANALITRLAERDSLTGLGNRSWFLRQGDQMLCEQQESGKSALTLFLVDLDNFKVVNDTSGHHAGDELLRQVADRFQSVSKGGAVLARFGGDEFAAIGQFVSERAAGVFAEELVKVTRKPFRVGSRDFAIGATVGYTRVRDPQDALGDLMRKADIALYKAKESGRNRALAFADEMEAEVRERRELEADLREAFENGKLRIEFQPIVAARSGEVVSSEVLVRWPHPERGDIAPNVFIPIAEHAGLILPMGSWVLREACSTAARCPDLESVAVNLSTVQFMDPNLVEMVSDVLMETGFPGERLVLEVTEAIFEKDSGAAPRKLKQLRDLGIRISLDDFGTGYSSLSYLRKYEFDKIKIDKSFVDEIGERSDGLAIISAVIALAHNLGLEVTAEGVERQFQVDALRTLGCDTMQGYYFGKPDPNPLRIMQIRQQDWHGRVPATAPDSRG